MKHSLLRLASLKTIARFELIDLILPKLDLLQQIKWENT
jgi:hypothetical protein